MDFVPQETKELMAIRKLLCAAFLKSGILSQEEIGKILGVDRSVISREFSTKQNPKPLASSNQ
jgi:predicted transcriptional regulator